MIESREESFAWVKHSKPEFCVLLKINWCKAEEPLQGMELQEKETQKDKGIQEICLEKTYS